MTTPALGGRADALRALRRSHREQRDPDEPRGVKLLGISSEVWTQLIIAMCILVTAIAGYLGRKKIPGLRLMTKGKREKRKAAKARMKATDGVCHRGHNVQE